MQRVNYSWQLADNADGKKKIFMLLRLTIQSVVHILNE